MPGSLTTSLSSKGPLLRTIERLLPAAPQGLGGFRIAVPGQLQPVPVRFQHCAQPGDRRRREAVYRGDLDHFLAGRTTRRPQMREQ
jgi:hypothetical protein